MKFNPQYFEKNPIELVDNMTGRPLPPIPRVFHTYSLKQKPSMSLEQAHSLLKDEAAFKKLSIVDRVGIQQVIANHQADRLGIPHPKVRIVPNIPIVSLFLQGLANGDTIYINENTLKSNEWSHNTPVHETTHLKQFADERFINKYNDARSQYKLLSSKKRSGVLARQNLQRRNGPVPQRFQRNIARRKRGGPMLAIKDNNRYPPTKNIILKAVRGIINFYWKRNEQDARNEAIAYQKEYGLHGDFERYETRLQKGINFEKRLNAKITKIEKTMNKIFKDPIKKAPSVRQQISHTPLSSQIREQNRSLDMNINKKSV